MKARTVLRWMLLATLLVVTAAGTVAGWAWWLVHQPFRGHAGSAVVDIPTGRGATAILSDLEEAGVLADARLARAYLVYVLDDPPLRAGEYRFEEPLDVPTVLDKLVRGTVVTHPVTVIEGLTLDETAAALSAAGVGDEDVFRRIMRDPTPIADLDPEATDLEGYLYPDTYHFARGTPESDVVATMVRTFRERWSTEVAPRLGAREPSLGTSVRAIVTLASVVEKEAQLDDERAVIAGVYANRLRRGIALYADPTVIFAIKLRGDWDGNLRKDDLRYDSPYNTYVNPGLPPGPICSPTVANLLAAAEPADVPYLYFVSRNDGSHVFAETLREHNRNVNEWQKRYWRERWAEERRSKASGT